MKSPIAECVSVTEEIYRNRHKSQQARLSSAEEEAYVLLATRWFLMPPISFRDVLSTLRLYHHSSEVLRQRHDDVSIRMVNRADSAKKK